MIYAPGVVQASIQRVLSDFPFFEAYRRGQVTRLEYVKEFEASLRQLVSRGVHLDDLYLSSRTPVDQKKFAYRFVAELETFIDAQPDVAQLLTSFDSFSKKVEAKFNHKSYSTYIYSEEALAAYLLAAVVRPKKIAFAGSYYAYWAIWFLAAASAETEAILIDPDEEVLELGVANIRTLLPGIKVQAECSRAEAALKQYTDYDLLVIDAELPHDHPDRFLSGKNLYHDILLACDKTATSDCVLCCHNIILQEKDPIPYLQSKAHLNKIELADFLDHCRSNWGGLVTVDTTEGIGLAFRGQDPEKQ